MKSSLLQNNGSAKELTEQAMYLGTHQFNKGNHFACGSLYEMALHSQIALPEDPLSQENLKVLKISTDKAEQAPFTDSICILNATSNGLGFHIS